MIVINPIYDMKISNFRLQFLPTFSVHIFIIMMCYDNVVHKCATCVQMYRKNRKKSPVYTDVKFDIFNIFRIYTYNIWGGKVVVYKYFVYISIVLVL